MGAGKGYSKIEVFQVVATCDPHFYRRQVIEAEDQSCKSAKPLFLSEAFVLSVCSTF